jgi:hypothetical protein
MYAKSTDNKENSNSIVPMKDDKMEKPFGLLNTSPNAGGSGKNPSICRMQREHHQDCHAPD